MTGQGLACLTNILLQCSDELTVRRAAVLQQAEWELSSLRGAGRSRAISTASKPSAACERENSPCCLEHKFHTFNFFTAAGG